MTILYKRVDVKKFLKHYRARITDEASNELRMCCILPGHRDNSPSASFNLKKGMYNCYVCGGRNFFSLVKDLENLSSFNEAVEFVIKMTGYTRGEDEELNKITSLLDEVNELQIEDVNDEEKPEFLEVDFTKIPEFEDAEKHFLKVKRRVSRQMIHLWNLKYAVSGYYQDRLILPIVYQSKLMSFAARDMTLKSKKWLSVLKQAKKDKLTVTEIDELREKYGVEKILYPLTKDKMTAQNSHMIFGTNPKFLLFNFDNAIRMTRDYVILVEGIFDAMRLFCWGFNAIALLGTKLSKYKRSLILANFEKVYVALDNDVNDSGKNPGQDAACKIIESLKNDVDIHNILLPPNTDPDECSREQFDELFQQADKVNF
ncbi:MAG: CHC2 zinc finger domain-containing protein [Nitrosarchaeum sp.]|nr:CHC2 zinc finger domain-containing protein [Nitrosarchaeum sp.]